MNYDLIKPYIEKKLVNEQRHPENEDVAIFNYSQVCQFSQAWDEVTRQCRGLIMNVKTGEILAKPFPKFFNYGEHVSKGWAIPTGKFEVQEKLDGSLGILYALNGKSFIATRGSFTSDQAQWATKWFREAMESDTGDVVVKSQTALFEIIYPQNRIVVNYNFSGLVHLATIDKANGRAIDVDHWPTPFRVAARVDCEDINTLEKMDTPNSEGFVIFYPEENVRMKVKFPEYVRLHKLVTGLSEKAVWEHLRDGKEIKQLVENVPDEFFKWVSEVAGRLINDYETIAVACERIFEKVKDLPTRKEQATAIAQFDEKYHGIVFAILDKKPQAVSGIWKQLRPHRARPYKVDIDS